MHQKHDTYMNMLNHIFNSDYQHISMSKGKTEYIGNLSHKQYSKVFSFK